MRETPGGPFRMVTRLQLKLFMVATPTTNRTDILWIIQCLKNLLICRCLNIHKNEDTRLILCGPRDSLLTLAGGNMLKFKIIVLFQFLFFTAISSVAQQVDSAWFTRYNGPEIQKNIASFDSKDDSGGFYIKTNSVIKSRQIKDDLKRDKIKTFPMPLPTWNEPKGVSDPENRIMYFDSISGKTLTRDLEIKPVQKESDRSANIMGQSPLNSHLDELLPAQPSNFSNLSQVITPQIYPWSVNCRLQIFFTDINGNTISPQGSGVLIDPLHVLTAGHVVYSHTITTPAGNVTVNDWADSIWVVPAFDNFIEPFVIAIARRGDLASFAGGGND